MELTKSFYRKCRLRRSVGGCIPTQLEPEFPTTQVIKSETWLNANLILSGILFT